MNDNKDQPVERSETAEKEKMIKQLAAVVCICKGIPLSKFLPVLGSCDTVDAVNQKVGSGTGGCAGQRCGPRIKKLLAKQKAKG